MRRRTEEETDSLEFQAVQNSIETANMISKWAVTQIAGGKQQEVIKAEFVKEIIKETIVAVLKELGITKAE